MASSVFYRFKSQKEPSRITFDGMGISVFELKRAIIEKSNLGDGSDFELTLNSSDGPDVYDDDTEIIPRSTIVIAKRQPALRPGRGGAARYVSGKPPASSKNTQRAETASARHDQQNGINTSAAASAIFELPSEKQREEAVLKLGADMWKNQQKEMASVAPVRTNYRPKPTSADNAPPEWYVCNRCSVKGHWIKDCPQNGNPDFDDNRRIKKSIGIPRSRLEIIDKKTLLGIDGNVDSSKLPVGAMIDGDGNYVIVKPDQATWNKYQEKANKSAAAQEEEARGSRELQYMGLECPIDKRLFVEPTKTPCCQSIYCKECITNALLDEDLRCPNCGREGIIIDNLMPADEKAVEVQNFKNRRDYAAQRQSYRASTEAIAPADSSQSSIEQPSLTIPNPVLQATDAPQDHFTPDIGQAASLSSPPELASRKRKADAQPENNRKSPAVMSVSTVNDITGPGEDLASAKLRDREPPRGPRALVDKGIAIQASSNNPSPGLPAGISTSIGPMMNMMPMMWDSMAIFNPFGAMNAMYSPLSHPGLTSQGINVPDFQSQSFGGGRRGNRQNLRGNPTQPFRTFNASRPNPEENAYFRSPVNPHRYQNRRNIPRPTDYREI